MSISSADIFLSTTNLIKLFVNCFLMSAVSLPAFAKSDKNIFLCLGDNLFSVNESRKNPYFNMVELKNKKVR